MRLLRPTLLYGKHGRLGVCRFSGLPEAPTLEKVGAMSKQTSNKFSPEVRSRAVRLVLDHEHDHPSRWATIVSVSAKIGCTAQTSTGVGKEGGGRQWQAGGRSDPYGPEAEGLGAREPRTSTGERDSSARRQHILPRRSSTAG